VLGPAQLGHGGRARRQGRRPATLPAATATTTAGRASYDAVVLADHPVAFWDMSQPDGTEPDLTANGHTGSYLGDTHAMTALPNGDAVVDLNGSGQYMTVASSPVFSIPTTQELTWEAWIRPDTLQWTARNDPEGYNDVDFMGKCQDYSPSCEWEARMYDSVNPQGRCNRLSAYVFNPTAGEGSGADWQPDCGSLKAGQWFYVVGEYQTGTTPTGCDPTYPGSINIWVDGTEWDADSHAPTGCMSQFDISPAANGSPLNIGTMALDTWFPGAIGKVALYDTLLTPAQIDQHFEAMTGRAPSGSCAETCNSVPVP
jgi:hypothetical protein